MFEAHHNTRRDFSLFIAHWHSNTYTSTHNTSETVIVFISRLSRMKDAKYEKKGEKI